MVMGMGTITPTPMIITAMGMATVMALAIITMPRPAMTGRLRWGWC
jgi:hypothetical protein